VFRKLPSPAIAIAALALFVALGGTGYAASQIGAGDDGATASKKKAKRGPRGPQGPAGPAGKDGADGRNGLNGAPGATGAAGTNGTNGAMGPTGLKGATGATGASGSTGATGATGATGVTGTSGAVSAGSFAGQVQTIPASAFTKAFYGPTTTVTLTSAAQRITATAVAVIATSAGTIPSGEFQPDLCYQLGAGTITGFNGPNYTSPVVTTTRTNVAVTGSVVPAAVGTYKVGFCAINGTATQINNNDFVTGWALVTG
jgi:collagen type VII alpha